QADLFQRDLATQLQVVGDVDLAETAPCMSNVIRLAVAATGRDLALAATLAGFGLLLARPIPAGDARLDRLAIPGGVALVLLEMLADESSQDGELVLVD